MVDILGPADAVGAVTTRPADERSWGAVDTFFKDCSSDTAEDGTDIRASWLNGISAVLRSLWRANGKLADNVTPVVAENGSDDAGLARAVQNLIQRGQTVFGVDIGSTNHLAVTLSPPLLEYKAGVNVLVSTQHANTAGADIAINGLGAKQIIRRDGSVLRPGDITGGGTLVQLAYDGTNFEMVSATFDRPTLTAARVYYVRPAPYGDDTHDGLSTDYPFATWQHAIDVVAKLNTNGFAVRIVGMGGTYGVGAYIGTPFFGGGTVSVEGNGDTIVVAAGSCFTVAYGAELSIGNNLVLQSNDAGNGAVTAQFGGLINITGDMHFNACSLYHIGALDGGQVRLRAPNYHVDGGAVYHWIATDHGRVFKDTAGAVNTIFGAGVAFSGAVAYVRNLALMLMLNFTYSGAPTGSRFNVTNNAVLDTSGGGASFLPGSTPGTTATGGVYS